jgi:hypothetical protein
MSEITEIINTLAESSPANDPTTLGNLLRVYCGLTEHQVGEAVQAQKGNKTLKLGDAVVALGYATPTQVAKVLERQRRLRHCERAGVWDAGKLADWVAEKLLRWRR